MAIGVKRKRGEFIEFATQQKALDPVKESPEESVEQVKRLEALISESNKHLNHLRTLLGLIEKSSDRELIIKAAIASCRVFCRLIARGTFKIEKNDRKNPIVEGWLEERYDEYIDLLVSLLGSENNATQRVAVSLLMRLAKTEAQQCQARLVSTGGALTRLIRFLITNEEADIARSIYINEYLKMYQDVTMPFCRIFVCELPNIYKEHESKGIASHGLQLLQSIDYDQHNDETPQDLYFREKANLRGSATSLKKAVQAAWLELLKLPLAKQDLKSVLTFLPYRIAPWFTKAELLMDFLTDAYNAGGGVALLALSGLFYLIQERNLDYPAFYKKLYSLLDNSLLHSKYRSQFFRQLEVFMSSTHLPAILVAAFIKKLSRLTLLAPPAGIVAVIPWIYNMIVTHRSCAFMIHRETRDPYLLRKFEESGMSDPFIHEEPDPMQSHALDSSLWEIQSLQSHYHPQVAALAKIISEQFTKRSYNLEDFLNHSYDEIIGSELQKFLKRAPAIEENVSDNVFFSATGEITPLGSLAELVMASDA